MSKFFSVFRDPFNSKNPLRYPILAFIVVRDHFENYLWFFLSKIFNKPLVYIVGDSHTMSLRRHPWFVVKHIGACTAYKLASPNSTTNSNRKFWNFIQKMDFGKDKLIMVFGEIDCRIHIYNQYLKREKEESLEELIDNTINEYGKIMKELSSKGVDFYVLGIPPASTEENVYNYPNYAPLETRVYINKSFNKKLENYCNSRGYKFIDVYTPTVNLEGTMKEKFAFDKVHLNRKIQHFVDEALEVQI